MPPFPISDSCRACKPNFVCRSFLLAHLHRRAKTKSGRDGHSSRPRITARLQRPTRKLWRTEPARAPAEATLLPYLVLLRVGFSLPPPLLTARCALTAPFHPYPALQTRRYIFCGTFRRRRLNAAARTLSGTLLCGVRTFLSLPAQPLPPKRAAARMPVSADRQRPSGPAANRINYRCSRESPRQVRSRRTSSGNFTSQRRVIRQKRCFTLV